MNIFQNICIGISVGIMLGFAGGIQKLIARKEYTQEQRRRMRKIIRKITIVLKYITLLMLALGFVWCIYFMALGIFVPEQLEYANNMSQLIVSVLTVISIMFAFAEFISRTNES